MTHAVETLVVGAGIAGLAYAHRRGPDADLHVLEAGARPGGLVQTHADGATHHECGPEALQDDAPEMLALIEDLGLRAVPADAAAKNRYVLGEQGLLAVPTSPGAFLKSPLLSLGGRLRALSEPWRKPGVALEGSIADFVRHRLGRQVLERMVDPAIAGIYAGDAETTSLRAAFPKLYDMAREHGSIMGALKAKAKARKARGEPRPPPPSLLSVAGGLQRVPDTIAERLGERLHLDTPVTAVARDGEGWRVQAGGGDWTARRLVLATPAAPAAKLLADVEPELSRRLGSMRAESVVVVAQVWPRAAVAHPLDGFGYLVPTIRGLRHLGTLFSSAIVPERCAEGRVLIKTLLGGARDPGIVELDDDALVELVVREVGPLLGLGGGDPSARPERVHISRWTSALPRYDLEQPRRQDAIDARLDELGTLSILGNHRRGIAVNALVETSAQLARAHGGPA